MKAFSWFLSIAFSVFLLGFSLSNVDIETKGSAPNTSHVNIQFPYWEPWLSVEYDHDERGLKGS